MANYLLGLPAGFFFITGNLPAPALGDNAVSATGDGFRLCMFDGLLELAELRDELRE